MRIKGRSNWVGLIVKVAIYCLGCLFQESSFLAVLNPYYL